MTVCFRLPKTYHRYDRMHGPWEWSSTSTGRMKDGGLDYRKGGTGLELLCGRKVKRILCSCRERTETMCVRWVGAALVGIMCAIRSRFCSSSLEVACARAGQQGGRDTEVAAHHSVLVQPLVEQRGSVAFLGDHVVQVNVTAAGAPTAGQRRGPRTTKAARLHWQEHVGVEEDGQTFAIRVGVELGRDGRGRVSIRRAPPAFHCKSDSRYCTWRRSLTRFDMERSNLGFGCPDLAVPAVEALGMVNNLWRGRFGAQAFEVPPKPDSLPDESVLAVAGQSLISQCFGIFRMHLACGPGAAAACMRLATRTFVPEK